MFSGASNFVEGVDFAFLFITGICVLFLIGIVVAMLMFVFKYNKKRHPEPEHVEENTKLEITWTVIPLIVVMAMFYYGWKGYAPMREIPKDAIPVKVTGRMWAWSFEYSNGKVSDTLVVPVGKPIRTDLFSPDVNHSFYIPAFRVKEDVVPGVNNKIWFQAEKKGLYDVFCTEYCGTRHAYMLSYVKVVDEEKYKVWLDTKPAEAPGLLAIKKHGCVSCHSLDGSKIVGPSFQGLYGKDREVDTDGSTRTVKADEEYVTRSIYEPQYDVVSGYANAMQSYKDIVTEEEIGEIIEYFKTLNE